jgi:predicted membrane protein
LRIGENADVTARIRGGVGQTQVILPVNAAVRVEASIGPGNIDLPSNYTRIQ